MREKWNRKRRRRNMDSEAGLSSKYVKLVVDELLTEYRMRREAMRLERKRKPGEYVS